MKGELTICDEVCLYPIDFQVGLGYFDLDIYVSKEKNLDDILKDKRYFIKYVDEKLFDNDMAGFHDEQEVLAATKLKLNFNHILDYIEFIKINNLNCSFRELVNDNPIVLTKKIVPARSFAISEYDELKKFAEENLDIKDNLYVILEGNSTYIKIDDALKTVEKIIDDCQDIKKCNLSQLETIMFVYDYVRDRVYQNESDEESYLASRDLTSVLFGDKIVCMGFTHLFNSMLNYLNIDYEEITYMGDLSDGKVHSGHIRSLISIDDDKYDVHGLYLFDPTWDSKKSLDDKNYLSRYKYFAKNVGYMSYYDKKNHLEQNRYLKYYDEKYFIVLNNALKNGDTEKLTIFIESLNHMARRVIGGNLIKPVYAFSSDIDRNVQQDILKKYIYIVEYLKREIPAETMIQLVNNVRKLEYYSNPDKYPYDIKTIIRIVIKSEWNFKNEHLSPNEKLLRVLFGEDLEKRTAVDNLYGYIEENHMEKDIQRVKVAKALRRVLEKKTK